MNPPRAVVSQIEYAVLAYFASCPGGDASGMKRTVRPAMKKYLGLSVSDNQLNWIVEREANGGLLLRIENNGFKLDMRSFQLLPRESQRVVEKQINALQGVLGDFNSAIAEVVVMGYFGVKPWR